ncbi:DNA polymerase III subunit beta [Suttonella ornithocola]|uniref:Beta sliding clamp n=1 Tax=Suttonella ornithocola TaxID=279832 RepID=A0A380MQG9_9GAMM|nr:DNA polymerase III subunit beta [Suttonella ornithocola]SUO94153.1 DNA polymerase III subunit beta [Suttonella ornithocola]
MKFEIVKNLLFSRLADINGIVDSKSPHPILSHVLVEAKNGQLRLLATDTELSLSAVMPANIQQEGITTVIADKFHQIIHRLPDDVIVQCTLEDDQFHIRAGSSHFKLSTLPAEDFPNIDESETIGEIRLDAADLFNILNKVRFSMAKNDVRHYLNGLLLNVISDGREIEAAATDGHRLSCAYTPLKTIGSEATQFILPEKATNALIKQLSLDNFLNELQLEKNLASDVETLNIVEDKLKALKDIKRYASREQSRHFERPVTLRMGSRELSLDTGSYHLLTRLIDGQYPDYRQIIPERLESPILIDRKNLLGALRRSQVLLNNVDNGLLLRFEGHQLYLSARNMQNETGEEKLDIVNNEDIRTQIGLNVGYFIDAVSNIDGDTLQMHVEDVNSPVLLTSKDDPEVRYIIMPMLV